MTTLTGTELQDRDALVVGGTGNIGFFLVDGYLRAGARVFVTSRSQPKIDHLIERLGEEKASHLVPMLGDIGAPEGAHLLQQEVQEATGGLQAVVASPASWHQTPSMFRAGFADFKSVIETRLYPHYLAAEAFLPLLNTDGSYTTINGPAGFTPAPYPGTGAISVAAAAQNKLIAAFAAETGGTPRVNDVIMSAYMGPQGTRPGSPLTGEQVADFIVALATKTTSIHGQTLNLHDPRQIDLALTGDFTPIDRVNNSCG